MPDKKPYLDSAGLTTVVNNIKSQFAKKADLSTKSDTGHTHDNRYYTETEIDNKLAQKSDLGHTHDKLVLDSVELTMDKIANDNYAFYPQVLSSQNPESTSIQGCSLGISASPWTSLYAKDIILEGTHLSTKFSDIDSSISSLNTALSGKANTNHTHSIANVTNLQTTLDGKAAKSHTHTVSQISDLTATAKELNYMDGVTSGVQGQLDSLSAVVAGKSDSNHTHTVATTTAAGFMSANDKSKLDNIANNANNYSLPAAGTSLGGVKTGGDVTITNGLISVNDNSHTHIISNVSGLQDELNGKASASHSHDDRYYTEAEIDAKINAIVGEGAAETLDTIGEISSAIQENQTMLDTLNDAIGKKQNIITGAATTIANANLTTNRALVSNGSGKVGVSAVTATELSYLDGVTSNVQSQLNGKAASGHTHNYAGSSSAGGAANSAAKLSTARTISLTGDAAGSVSFDGSGDASISTTVSSMHGVTTAGTGAAYTATVAGITALTAGVSFIMIPHTNSTSTTPTLNVNSLGAKGIRMRGSTATGTAMTAAITAWLASGRPVQVTYNGVYWLAETTRLVASDLSGTVAIANGGTGATTAAAARTNLGLRVDTDYDADFTVGTKSINSKSCGYAKMSSGNAHFEVIEDPRGKRGVFDLDYILGYAADRSIPVAYSLYSNASGTTGTVTLSDSADNYDYLEIYAVLQDGVCATPVNVRSPNGKTVDLNWAGVWSSGNVAIARARVTISGTSITFNSNYQVTMVNGGTHTVSTNAANLIYITRVVGYKFGYSQSYQ